MERIKYKNPNKYKGIVDNIFVKEGQIVKEGQTLAIVSTQVEKFEIIAHIDCEIHRVNIIESLIISDGDIIFDVLPLQIIGEDLKTDDIFNDETFSLSNKSFNYKENHNNKAQEKTMRIKQISKEEHSDAEYDSDWFTITDEISQDKIKDSNQNVSLEIEPTIILDDHTIVSDNNNEIADEHTNIDVFDSTLYKELVSDLEQDSDSDMRDILFENVDNNIVEDLTIEDTQFVNNSMENNQDNLDEFDTIGDGSLEDSFSSDNLSFTKEISNLQSEIVKAKNKLDHSNVKITEQIINNENQINYIEEENYSQLELENIQEEENIIAENDILVQQDSLNENNYVDKEEYISDNEKIKFLDIEIDAIKDILYKLDIIESEINANNNNFNSELKMMDSKVKSLNDKTWSKVVNNSNLIKEISRKTSDVSKKVSYLEVEINATNMLNLKLILSKTIESSKNNLKSVSFISKAFRLATENNHKFKLDNNRINIGQGIDNKLVYGTINISTKDTLENISKLFKNMKIDNNPKEISILDLGQIGINSAKLDLNDNQRALLTLGSIKTSLDEEGLIMGKINAVLAFETSKIKLIEAIKFLKEFQSILENPEYLV